MLPLLSKPRVRVYIHPEQISVAQLSGRIQPKIDNYQVFSVSANTSTQQPELLLTCLEQALSSLPKGSRLDLMIANHYCRFLVLPWHEALDQQGREQLSMALFQQHYAPEQASDYYFVWDECRFGQAQLATAIAKPLLQTLEQLILKQGHLLSNLQPSLGVVWNRFYRQLTQQTLIIQEYHRHYVIKQQQGYIQQVIVQPSSLPLAMEQSVYFTDDAKNPVYHNEILRLKPYQLPSDCEDAYQAFTLCGVF